MLRSAKAATKAFEVSGDGGTGAASAERMCTDAA